MKSWDWLLRRGRMDRELAEEMAAHFEEKVADMVEAGMPEPEARQKARREFGNAGVYRDKSRDFWGWTWLERLLQDARFAVRTMRQNPGFTALAVSSLALGIGANTVIFSLIDGTLLRRLPYPHPDRLMAIWTVPPSHRGWTGATVDDYREWSRQAQSFESMGVELSAQGSLGAEKDGAPAEAVMGKDITPSVFRVLGVQPILGRTFTPSEEEAPVALISYRLWMRRFNGDRKALGKGIRMQDGQQATIIGVMPANFTFFDEGDQVDFWHPLHWNPAQLKAPGRAWHVAARLKPGVSIGQAQQEMDAIAVRLGKSDPGLHAGWGVKIQSLREYYSQFWREPLTILEAAVGFLLLIACANVAGLLLARASGRRQEIAVRAAIGAGKRRIIRQLLTESMLLSVCGGAAGILLAYAGIKLLVATSPQWTTDESPIGINLQVLGFTGLLSISTGLIFGLSPAFQASRLNLVNSLKEASGGASGSGSGGHFRSALVMLQIGLALVLSIGAGLLIHSFVRLLGADVGCDPHGLLTFEYRVPRAPYAKLVGRYHGFPLASLSPVPSQLYDRIVDRLRLLPGVTAAAGVMETPLTGGSVRLTFGIDGRPILPARPAEADAQQAVFYSVTPNFFETMKIPIRMGRDFNSHDTVAAPWTVIINQTMARRFWPNENPIGRSLKLDLVEDEQPREVIGVVGDTAMWLGQTNREPVMYVPHVQLPPHWRGPYWWHRMQMTFILRTTGDPNRLIPGARRVLADIDPDVPMAEVRTLDDVVGDQVGRLRSYVVLLTVFGLIATILAAVGIYGAVAYTVAQRTHEIGIRVALGAGAPTLVWLVLRQTLLLLSIGLIAGLAGSMALTRLIRGLLWGVTATDPATLTAVSFLLVLVGVVACLIPTIRALKLNPVVALRSE